MFTLHILEESHHYQVCVTVVDSHKASANVYAFCKVSFAVQLPQNPQTRLLVTVGVQHHSNQRSSRYNGDFGLPICHPRTETLLSAQNHNVCTRFSIEFHRTNEAIFRRHLFPNKIWE